MPLINYVALRELVEELDALAGDAAPDAAARRRREDALYTVCVYTGVRDPRRALALARRLLAVRPVDVPPSIRDAGPAAAPALARGARPAAVPVPLPVAG